MRIFGGIEAGGTKFVCAVGTGPDNLRARAEFPTTTPEETIARAVAFFREHGPVAALGIASFGPVDLRAGRITSTPKPGWANTEFAGAVRRALDVPVAFDTDTNGAALAERRWGAARGLETFLYLTIGTGIGGGGMVNGRLMHGRMHPEVGHVRIPHDRAADPFPGACPYHGDCLEGLAAGPAIEARWGRRGETLPPDHPAWELEARYLALGILNFVCTISPELVIVGGGVMRQAGLLEMVRRDVRRLLNEYLEPPEIVAPALSGNAGVLGAMALGEGCS